MEMSFEMLQFNYIFMNYLLQFIKIGIFVRKIKNNSAITPSSFGVFCHEKKLIKN